MVGNIRRALIAAALTAGFAALGAKAAEPLQLLGIGTTSCARLAGDLKPAEGLANPVNLMMYAWAQGYMSAANIALLEDDSKHIDMGTVDDAKLLAMVQAFCKANPDKRPVAALDEFIKKAGKTKSKWDPGTIDWGG